MHWIVYEDGRRISKCTKKNKTLMTILERAGKLGMPNWYLGAGCISQTVWNVKHKFDPENGIKDYDLVYYDASDISYEAEDVFIQKGKEVFGDLGVDIEIRNQARVHLWYEKHFGKSIEQYKSAEEAIFTWPTTASSVGVRKENRQFKIYAAFGLDDLLNMTLRANKIKITEKIYQNKVDKWTKVWPRLKVIPW